jgi:hypothetical protein
LVIKNTVGGWLKIEELGIKLGPGQLIDLDFCCSRQTQESSKELKRAISRHFVRVILDGVGQVAHTYEGSIGIGSVMSFPQQEQSTLRRAVFVRTDVPVNPSYEDFVMRDLPSKLAMVITINDPKLLGTVIRGEENAQVVQAAYKRLQGLVG